MCGTLRDKHNKCGRTVTVTLLCVIGFLIMLLSTTLGNVNWRSNSNFINVTSRLFGTVVHGSHDQGNALVTFELY